MEFGASYFGVRDVRHVRRDLDRFADEGLNAVLHTFSERDEAFYGETMADIVAESSERGFRTYVNPWAVGKVFGGEAFSSFLAKHPDSRQKTATGERQHGACFNDPAFRSRMHEWTETAVDLEPDVLFWDEPHWIIPEWFGEGHPNDDWLCRCEHCRDRYESEYGKPMPACEDETVRQFREDSLFEFLGEMMAISTEAGVENSVCLVPHTDADHGITDWERLASGEHIDQLSTDPYWGIAGDADVEELVTEATNRVVELAEDNGLESQIWIQGFNLDDDPAEYNNIRTATETAIDCGADSVFMWGWDGCRVISEIASKDPDRVWKTYLDAIGNARD